MLGEHYEVHGLDIVDPQVPLNEFYRCDIKRPFEVPGDIEYDAVIHLAALVNVGESEHMPIKYYITNLNGTMNVVNKIKTKNFIFASTGAAVSCESAYGISKRAAEDVVREFCTSHRPTPYTIFRFYNVIGSTVVAPTNPDGLMYNLMKARETGEFTVFGNDYERTGDGTCVRDYVHVSDVADAHVLAAEHLVNGKKSQILNLGTGRGYSVQDIVNLVKKVTGQEVKYGYETRRAGDPPFLIADISLAEKVLTYRPKHDIISIIKTAYEWHLKHGTKN
jgi:UDP-glucose 4-epimerase